MKDQRMIDIQNIIETKQKVRIHFHKLGVDLRWEDENGENWRPIAHHEAEPFIYPPHRSKWNLVPGFHGECCYWRL